MSNKLDLTNKRFGKWTVIEEAERIPNNQGVLLRAWLCECDCGTRRVVRQSVLTSGNSTSCGCSRIGTKDRKLSKGKYENYIGQKYGRLTITGDAPKPNHVKNGRYVYCICDCSPDTIMIKNLSNIINGGTRSCGCLQKEQRSSQHGQNTYDLSHDGYGIGYDKKGNEFYFSLSDYNLISQYVWDVHSTRKYVISHKDNIIMHRLIMNAPDNSEVDHINSVKYDNRRENLRLTDHIGNRRNMPKRSERNPYPSVFPTKSGKWGVSIGYDGKKHNLGVYDDLNEAIKVKQQAEDKVFGEFSYANSQAIAAQYAIPEIN